MKKWNFKYQIASCIQDELSFMRFLDLNIREDVPDSNTIRNFKEALTKACIIEKLFEKFGKELEKKDLIANKGSIVDASFVEVPKQRNTKDENDKIKNNETPDEWKKNPNKLSHKDLDARWATKNHQKYFGYKNHVKIDVKSKLITKYGSTDTAPCMQGECMILKHLKVYWIKKIKKNLYLQTAIDIY